MMQLDHLIDKVTEMFIINVTDSDSECNDSEKIVIKKVWLLFIFRTNNYASKIFWRIR
jgi:hypothetical protein